MLDVKASLEFDLIETYQHHLAIHSDDALLRVPTELRNWRVGGQAALIHFMTNWATRFDKPQLVLYAKTMEEALIQGKNLGSTHHGLVAMLASSNILLSDKKPLSPQFTNNLIADLIAYAFPTPKKPAPSQSKPPGIWRGPNVLFLCSNRRNQEFPQHLYHTGEHQKPTVKNAIDFGNLFDKVIQNSINVQHKKNN